MFVNLPNTSHFIHFFNRLDKRNETFIIRLITRIEPVGKPYREVCLQTKW